MGTETIIRRKEFGWIEPDFEEIGPFDWIEGWLDIGGTNEG